MSGPAIQLVGGPLDGDTVDLTRGAFLILHGWVYFWDDGCWRFAGHQARECEGCGAILGCDRETGRGCTACPLCGA